MKKFTGTFASIAVITALATPAFAQAPQSQSPSPSQPYSTQQAPETQDPSTTQRDRTTPTGDMSSQRDDSATAHKAERNTVTGELVKVDTDQMEITIKSAEDKEHTFRYADSTKVDGAQEQVSGLATRAGQLVTVYYTEGAGDTRIATKVKFDKNQDQ
jgi:cytoskeletal protein RodZ